MNQYNQMPYEQQNPYGQQMQPLTGQMPYGQQMQPLTGQMPYGQQMQPLTGQMPHGQQMQTLPGQMPTGVSPMQGMMGGQQMPGTMGTQDWQDFCKRYRHHFVNLQTTDGQQYEGIIDGTDQENVYMLVPDGDSPAGAGSAEQRYDEDYENEEELDTIERYGGFGGYPGFGYGGYPWYGFGGYPRRFRRFRRHRFPFFRVGGFFFPIFI